MTINNSSRTAGPFIGNGSTLSFPFNFKVFARSDVLVARTVTATGVETILVLDSDYTVNLNSGQDSNPGGTVNMSVAPPVGTTLAATSNLTIQQNLDLTNGGGFYPTAINNALDRIVIFIQQLNARVGLGALNVGAAATVAAILNTLTTLAGSTGSSLIGFIQAGVGAILRTMQAKARERISICDYGGADDWNGTTGTNSFSALSKIYATYPNGVTIYLPKLGTGIYYLNGSQFTASGAGFVFEPDDGVSFYKIGSYIPTLAAGVKFTRQVPMRDVASASTFYFGPEAYRGVSGKHAFAGQEIGEAPTVFSITQSSANTYGIAWPDGPVTSVAPTSSAPDTTTWAPASTTQIRAVTKPIRPGSEISCYFSDRATAGFPYAGSLAAVVITDAGFVSVRQDVTGGQFIASVKSGAAAIVETGATPPTAGQANYRFYYGLVSIRVHSPRSFSVLSNGVEVVRVPDAGGNILQAGFGPAFATNANDLSVAGMHIVKAKRAMGVQPLRLVVVGDSITDPAVPCSWSDYMRQYLAGAGGTQILELKNIAVSGATSTDQNTALLATTITGFNYCLIQIGVNDIQGAAAVATLINNITSMVNYCRTNSVIPIVGVPSIFYGTVESAGTGNTGQATTYNSGGSPYRATLLRYLASAGVVANLGTLNDMGAIIPALITATNVDSVVADNIHPTAYGRMVYGWSWTKALIGQILPKVDKSLSNSSTVLAWFGATYGTTALPSYGIDGDNLSMAGYASVSADPAAGATVLTFPELLRPVAQFTCVVPTATNTGTPSGTAILQIGADGVTTIYAAAAGTRYIFFGGVNFKIAS